jgi:hypothetical protein
MAFQKNVRAVAGTIANGLREVATSSTKRSLFATAYELLAHASLMDPAIVALALVAFAWRRA